MNILLQYLSLMLFASSANASYDWGDEVLKIERISCSSGVVSADYHLKVGDEINMQVFERNYQIEKEKGYPVLLSHVDSHWILSAHFSSEYRDDFPCQKNAVLAVGLVEVSH